MITTGIVELKDGQTFYFCLDGDELFLDPTDDEARKFKNVFSRFDNPSTPFDNAVYIEGKCYPDLNPIIFMRRSTVGFINSRWKMKVGFVFIFNSEAGPVTSLTVRFRELNHIFDVGKIIDEKSYQEGSDSIYFKNNEACSSEPLSFRYRNKTISCYFFAGCRYSMSRGEQTPIRLTSSLIFNFEETADYNFLAHLFRVALEFVRFLCYRKNVRIDEAKIANYSKDNTSRFSGKMYYYSLSFTNEVSGNIEKDGYVPYELFQGHENKIMELLSKNLICSERLPQRREEFSLSTQSYFADVVIAFEKVSRLVFSDIPKRKLKDMNIEEKLSLVKSKFPNTYDRLSSVYSSQDSCSQDSMETVIRKERNKLFHGDVDAFRNPLIPRYYRFLERITYFLELTLANIDEESADKATGKFFDFRF